MRGERIVLMGRLGWMVKVMKVFMMADGLWSGLDNRVMELWQKLSINNVPGLYLYFLVPYFCEPRYINSSRSHGCV